MLLVLEQASKSYYFVTLKNSTKFNFVHLAEVQFWKSLSLLLALEVYIIIVSQRVF